MSEKDRLTTAYGRPVEDDQTSITTGKKSVTG